MMVTGLRPSHLISCPSKEEDLDTKDSNILVSKITFHSKPRLLKLKLFLYRSAFFLGGFAILVAGGIASRFSVYLDMSKNSTNCSSSGH